MRAVRREAAEGEPMDVGKLLWGVVLAVVFLGLARAFVKRASRSPDVKYNWGRVLLAFSAIGLGIYLAFFRQL